MTNALFVHSSQSLCLSEMQTHHNAWVGLSCTRVLFFNSDAYIVICILLGLIFCLLVIPHIYFLKILSSLWIEAGKEVGLSKITGLTKCPSYNYKTIIKIEAF